MLRGHPLHIDARRYVEGALLSRARPPRGSRGARPDPACSDGLARSAADRRRRRRAPAHQQGGGHRAIGSRGRGRRLPFSAGRRGPSGGERQPELRQHSRRHRALGDREWPRHAARSRHAGTHSHGEYGKRSRRARAHAAGSRRVRGRRPDRRRPRHRRRHPDRLSRYRGLELRRPVADGRGRRSRRGRRGDLHRQRHAGRRVARRRSRRVRLRGARGAREPTPISRRASNASVSRSGRA